MRIEDSAGSLPPYAAVCAPGGLITEWANETVTKLYKKYASKGGRLTPQTKPIYNNILLLKFVFDPERQNKTGRIRTLLVLWGHADYETRQCYPGIETIAVEAGLDEKNVRRNLGSLKDIGLLEKTHRPTKEGSKELTSNLYTLWDGGGAAGLDAGSSQAEDTHLINLVFAAATGELALYALALRELHVNAEGRGAARLDRGKVRKALEEGLKDASGKYVLDRTLSDEVRSSSTSTPSERRSFSRRSVQAA